MGFDIKEILKKLKLIKDSKSEVSSDSENGADSEKDSFEVTLIKAGLQMTMNEYLAKFLLPFIIIGTIIGGGTGVTLLIIAMQTANSSLYYAIFIGPIGGFLLGILFVYMYPQILKRAKKREIEDVMPLLITYMGGLSTSQASRDDIFHNVSNRVESFGHAAGELKRIRTMATEWNLGYIFSTKRVASTTPSNRFGDFLSRFSQALDSGENLSGFFRKEQDSILATYVADYTRSLKSLETLNDAYVAVSVSTVFMAVTFLIMMYLFGDTTTNNQGLISIILIIEFVNMMILLAFKAATPKDDLIARGRMTKEFEKIMYAAIIVVFMIIPLIIIILFVIVIGETENLEPIFLRDTEYILPIFMIIAGIAFRYPGVIAEKYEERISRRDENFPILIRTLGATAGVIGGSIFDSVKMVTRQHFGPLTEDIKLLYAQAQFGIDPHVAWQYFSDSTSSSIIDRFLKIFTSSLSIGGSPGDISEFISLNVEKILRLRKDKIQVMGTFKGTLLPLTVINIALMVFMKDVLYLLGAVMSETQNASEYGNVYNFGSPPDAFLLNLYFNIFFITIPIFTCIALTIPRKGTPLVVLKHLSTYYILVGIEIILVAYLSHAILGSFSGVYETINIPGV
ncbi:MAG: hypothetical protein GY870_05105 [archaeon]|nr:hypothetical protein [archaeon]